MRYLMTFDVGTTATKTSLFSESMELIAISSREYSLLTPGKDLVELEPDKYWEALRAGCADVMARTGVNREEIRSLTITTQGETLIPVDRQGNPLCNAIVWLDARAVREADWIGAEIGADEFYRHTGLPEAGPACPVSKVLWLKWNRDEIYRHTYKFMLLEDFLIQRLTGEFVSEQSLMTSTGYYDINQCALWDRMLEVIGVDPGRFPQVLPCGTIVAPVLPEIAAELGLSTHTVVVTGAMDQVASAVGAGNVKPGMVTETTGTAMVLAATAQQPDYSNPSRVTIYRHYNGAFLILPYSTTAGIILKWFKDEFCSQEIRESAEKGISAYCLLDEAAARVAPGAGGLILLPHFAGMMSPEINTNARGVFFGVSLETKREHFVRAILESVGFMLRENIELLEQMGVAAEEIRSLGGGSGSALWNAIKADITGKRIVVMEQSESTSLGAAMLGAIALGLFKSMEEVQERCIHMGRVFTPRQEYRLVYDSAFMQYRRLYESVRNLFTCQ